MDSWDLRIFRNDLSIFISKINAHGVTGDFSELNNMLEELNNKSLVEYRIQNLTFYINGRIVGTFPDDLNYCQIFLDNMLMVKDTLAENLDPLHAYSLDLNVSVYKSLSSTKKAYTSSWHLDRHINTSNVRYTHPTYHFQFGGKKLELIDPEMSVLSCPRIPHPPMDVFLATHFILSNFFNNKQFTFVNDLLNDFEYQQIIKRAQERLWTPYFKGYNLSNTHSDFTMQKIFPLYLN
ncbi:hypothetical protein [Spirosoma horti]